jgi:hypothetical protein
MPDMFTVEPLLFVTARFRVLVVPKAILLNKRLVGEKLSGAVEPFAPVPERSTTCGLNRALWLTVREPLIFPLVLGLNKTAMVHLAFGANTNPHGAELVPVAAK